MHNMCIANKYVGPPYFWAEMHAGQVACCPLVSHDEYAKGTDRQMGTKSLPYAFH